MRGEGWGGVGRFSSVRFSMARNSISSDYVHLTNVAVQKKAPGYDCRSGGKWDLRSLKLYMSTKFGLERVNRLFCEIQLVVIRSLMSVQKVMINDRNSFALHGYRTAHHPSFSFFVGVFLESVVCFFLFLFCFIFDSSPWTGTTS